MKNLRLNNLVKFLLSLVIVNGLCFQSGVFAEEAVKADNNKPVVTKANVQEQMDEYIAQTRRKIKNNWYVPSDAFENSATIVLTIKKDGTLENCYLSVPSKNSKFDESLINAAKKTTYSPLPEIYKGKSVDLGFDFSMQKRHISKEK